ncbi:hypothetical protein [Streptomyces sp. CC228A]|uniref:hypothetical protein n=1 Tax=Streptomyces sp. CC228A TaxID=2898186 RepID=UPI001F3B98A6|nr:hypothetical protein [Streptomyces sp. CC228A]
MTHSAAALAGLGAGLLIGLLAAPGGDGAPDGRPTATAMVTATTSPPGTSATRPPDTPPRASGTPDGEIPGDGTFLVGEDIAPGVYRSSGPADAATGFCSWFRLKGTTGAPEDIIAAHTGQGPATVTVLPGDRAFQTQGCAPWKKAAEAG